MVVVVVPGSTVVVVTAPGSIGMAAVVVVASGTSGAGGVAVPTGVDGAAGKRSARVVGRQAAWAGATATTETKAAQAKKSAVTRFLKVLSGYPPVDGVGSPFAELSAAGPLLLPGTRRSPSSLSPLSERGLSRGPGRTPDVSEVEEFRIRPLLR